MARGHSLRIRDRVIAGAAVLTAAAALTGCAQVGPPLPPSANLPAAPASFRAARSGDHLDLDWRSSTRTTDGAGQRGAIVPYLCLWPTAHPELQPPAGLPCPRRVALQGAEGAGAPGAASVPLARLAFGLPAAGAAPAAVETPFLLIALGFANGQGEVGAWSKFTAVPLTPAAPTPANLTASISPEGVRLTWQPVQPPPRAIRVYRRELAPQPSSFAPLADLPGGAIAYLDRQMQWAHRYAYRLRSTEGQGLGEVESDDSATVSVLARNVFPPPAPEGLKAVLAPGVAPAAADLSWQPVTAPRLAGYNVYRRRPGGAWERRNTSLVLTPVFRDAQAGVQEGGFEYAVTAVDQDGNQSALSTAANVR